MPMIKIFHRYLGLLLCGVMLTISLTGVVLVWKKEYLWLSVDRADEAINTDLIASAIDAIESSYAIGEVTFVQLYSEDLSLHKVFLEGRRYAWHDQRGKKIQEWSGNQRWEDFLLDLHHRFLLGNTIGLNIVGFGGLLLLPLIVIGVFIWWPRRRTLSKGLFPHSFSRGGVMRSHGNIGGVFTLPILLIALTGVILVYPIESRFILMKSTGLDEPVSTTNGVYDVSAGLPNWEQLIKHARQKFPHSRLRSVQPSAAESEKRTLSLQQNGGWHRLGRTSLTFYDDGRLIVKDEFKQPLAKRVFGFSYPLHAAKLGLLYRVAITFVGLAFCLLCLLGVASYLKRYSA